MHQPELIRPTYAESFRCIGPACEDICCKGWVIPVDRAANDRFQTLPPSPLRALIDANILLTPPSGDSSQPATFATFRMTARNACPLLTEESLCRIQTERGEAFLPHACATYPRIVYSVGNMEEKALALSCPEAARLVLLNPALLSLGHSAIAEPLCDHGQEGDDAEGAGSLQSWFWSIRKSVLALVLNRAFPLWQRLFLLGVFCRQLDSIAQGKLKSSTGVFLHDFEAAIASGAHPAAMEAFPVNLTQQLDVVLQLAGMLLHRSNVHPRFVDCVQAFTTGIGNGAGATLESLTAHYALAYERWYQPFFERQPHILENYLVNTILRCQFPFGRDAMRSGGSPSMTREHALLAAQFALMKGFLIGVAGFHGGAFSADHVIHTVQSTSKHFEHHPEFLNDAYALLVKNQMNNERGITILLRNDRASCQAEASSTAPSLPPAAFSSGGAPTATDRDSAARSPR
ncbi:MAG: flagellin lysine-N-methylase [Terriglobales bacterium]